MSWNFVSLAQGIEQAGSPIDLLWKPDAPAWKPAVVDDEYTGWKTEQTASGHSVALSDLSFHMSDTFLRGADATRLLAEVSANGLGSFAIGQAKQFVPVASDGNIISDGILLREADDRYVLSGVPAAQNWVAYHARTGDYAVDVETDPDRSFTPGDPRLFRLQVQGPAAADLVERAFGAAIPPLRFFHSATIEFDGAPIRALRHGMSGQAGYELIGDYAHHDRLHDVLMAAGDDLGVVRVGALAYATNGVDSGWIPTPTPAIYTAPELAGFRAAIGLYGYEGMNPLYGSFFSRDITDFYASPWELRYGRSIDLEHDFIGRDALRSAEDTVTRTKVTLELDPHDALGSEDDYLNDYGRHRIETDGSLVGLTFQTVRSSSAGRVLALALVEHRHAVDGTRLEVVWGRHPGADTPPDAELGFPRIGATVRPAPYDEYARSSYRRG